MPTTADLFCMVLLLFVGLTCFFLKGYLLPEESLDYQSLWQCSRWENILIHLLKCLVLEILFRCKSEVLQEQVTNIIS